jgi:hypothetical protein
MVGSCGIYARTSRSTSRTRRTGEQARVHYGTLRNMHQCLLMLNTCTPQSPSVAESRIELVGGWIEYKVPALAAIPEDQNGLFLIILY